MGLNNPKTTIPGYLILLGSLALFVAHLYQGTVGAQDLAALTGALAGVGLIAAKDGGH